MQIKLYLEKILRKNIFIQDFMWIKNPFIFIKNYYFINSMFNKVTLEKLNVPQKYLCAMKKHLINLNMSDPSLVKEAVKAFTEADIKLDSKIDIFSKIEISSPIVIVAIRDDIERIKIFLKYYREIGIEMFAFVSNNSTEETLKFLKEQKDVIIFKWNNPFTDIGKNGAYNRVMCFLNSERWYLLVDIDEYFDYIGREKSNIYDVIRKYEQLGYKKGKAIMVDMYPKGNAEKIETKNMLEEDIYFDSDSYSKMESFHHDAVIGGARGRISSKKVLVSKYPLIKFSTNILCYYSHYQYPYIDNYNIPCYFALRHYKFLKGDYEKYKYRVQKQGFDVYTFYNSYLKFYEHNNGAYFFYEGSIKYTDSTSLEKIYFMENMFEGKKNGQR